MDRIHIANGNLQFELSITIWRGDGNMMKFLKTHYMKLVMIGVLIIGFYFGVGYVAVAFVTVLYSLNSYIKSKQENK